MTHHGARHGAMTLFLLCLYAMPAHAQGVGEARHGQRFVSVGLSSQPGFIVDPDEPPTSAHRDTMTTWGTFVTAGLHHYLHPHFSMAAELGLGVQWFDDHTVSPTGEAVAEKALAWQLGLMGRYLPSSGLQGLSVGGGMHLFTARLEQAPVQQLAGEVRVGWMFWKGERQPRFGLVEVGMSAPVVQGLRLPDQLVTLDDAQEATPFAPSNWRLWRGTVAVQVSF